MSFAADGYTIVRGAVPSADVAAMRELFLAIMPEAGYPARPGIVHELTGLSRAYEPLAAIARDPRFGAFVAAALEAPRIQLLQDALLYKPPIAGGPVELHQDRTYIGYLQPPNVATLRIALEPEDDENGCMRVVAGSHQWGELGDNQSLTASSVASLVPHLSQEHRAQIDHARSLALLPGDISIHHCLALHGSPPNPSTRPRRTIMLRMFDARCTLDRARLPTGAESYFPTDAEGHLSTDAFPIVYG